MRTGARLAEAAKSGHAFIGPILETSNTNPTKKGPHEPGGTEPGRTNIPSSSRRGSSCPQLSRAHRTRTRTNWATSSPGQATAIEEVLIAVLCQGHALLEGVPGIAKTLMVKTLGRLLGLGFQRVQATPDLMPADILGTTILRPGTDTFYFPRGSRFH